MSANTPPPDGVNRAVSPSARLEAAIERLPPEEVTLADVRVLLGRDGLMLFAALLTLVFLVPVSIPGVSTVFGAAILLIGLSRLAKRDLWLPKRVARRTVATQRLRKALERGLTTFRRLERLSKPGRLGWATQRGAEVINDMAIIAGAILLVAPFGFVPFSNTLPALALLLLAIGSLQRDGACIVAGHVALVATAAYFVALVGGGGMAVLAALKHVFR